MYLMDIPDKQETFGTGNEELTDTYRHLQTL